MNAMDARAVEAMQELKKILTPETWAKGTGSMAPHIPRYCVISGLAIGVNAGGAYGIARSALDRVARNRGATCAWDYNDRPETTLDDIQSMIDEAIIALDH